MTTTRNSSPAGGGARSARAFRALIPWRARVRAREMYMSLYEKITGKPVFVVDGSGFVADGLATSHTDDFRNDADFGRAYARACVASGFDYNMPWRIHVAIWVAKQAMDVQGDLVELGTGRGFVMSAVLEYLGEHCSRRKVWLYDKFDPYAVDPITGDRITTHKHHYYAQDLKAVEANFSEWENVTLIPGLLPETLTEDPSRICFLHIDLNNAQVEVAALARLWPRLSPGAMVLLDDYAYVGFRAQYEAHSRWAREQKVEILSLPTGQGLLIKPRATPTED